MPLIAALVGFAGVVVFSILYVIAFFKGGSLKLPAIGMGVCFVLVVAVADLTHFEVGPFGKAITIDNENFDLKVGESSQIVVTAKATPVTYQTNDNSIAVVDSNGVVTATNAGSTIIIATDAKGHTAERTVNVSHIEPTALEFAQAELVVAPLKLFLWKPYSPRKTRLIAPLPIPLTKPVSQQ